MFFQKRPPLPDQLRVCFIAQQFPMSGMASEPGFLWPIARGLVRAGHQVSVISWKNPLGEERIEQDGVQAFYVGAKTNESSLYFHELAHRAFKKMHEESQFHLIHALDRGALQIAEHRIQLKIACIFDVEATSLSQVVSISAMSPSSIWGGFKSIVQVGYHFLNTYFKKDRHLLKCADGLFVCSQRQKKALERFYLYPELKTHLIPYGIELADLSPREESPELRKKFGLNPETEIILFKTDMVDAKEAQIVLKAFEKVAVKKPHVRLVILGKGPGYKDVEYAAYNLALGSRVRFINQIPPEQMSDFLTLGQIFINLNSRASNFDANTLEAMAQKKFVIVSEMGPLASLIQNEKEGFLVRPSDPHQLHELLLSVLNGNFDRSLIGDRARERVLDFFNTRKLTELTIQSYRQTLVGAGFFESPPQKNPKRIWPLIQKGLFYPFDN